MASADVTGLLEEIIKADPIIGPRVTHIVGSRTIVAVYSEALPVTPLMDPNYANKPSTAIVVATFPGTRDPDIPFRRPRVLIRCYGPTRRFARQLDLLVQDLLANDTFDVGAPDDPARVRLAPSYQSGPTVDIDTAGFPFADSLYEVPTI